jgi:hypothetical protein
MAHSNDVKRNEDGLKSEIFPPKGATFHPQGAMSSSKYLLTCKRTDMAFMKHASAKWPPQHPPK